jgi:hypothetical protein
MPGPRVWKLPDTRTSRGAVSAEAKLAREEWTALNLRRSFGVGPAPRRRRRRHPWGSAAEGRAPLLSGESLAQIGSRKQRAAAAAQGRVTPNGGARDSVGVGGMFGRWAPLAGACGEIGEAGRSGKAVWWWWSRRERGGRRQVGAGILMPVSLSLPGGAASAAGPGISIFRHDTDPPVSYAGSPRGTCGRGRADGN